MFLLILLYKIIVLLFNYTILKFKINIITKIALKYEDFIINMKIK